MGTLNLCDTKSCNISGYNIPSYTQRVHFYSNAHLYINIYKRMLASFHIKMQYYYKFLFVQTVQSAILNFVNILLHLEILSFNFFFKQNTKLPFNLSLYQFSKLRNIFFGTI